MNKIIPSTKVRTQWRRLVKSLPKEGAVMVTRHYNKEAVIADPDYFKHLEEYYNRRKMLEAMNAISDQFKKNLRKRGIDPDKLSEENVNKLLGID